MGCLGFTVLMGIVLGASAFMGYLTMIVWNALGIGNPVSFKIAWALWIVLSTMFNVTVNKSK